MEFDDLAPFLAQMGDPEKITRQKAYKLKEDCLMDLKQRLIDKATLINARLEKVDGGFCLNLVFSSSVTLNNNSEMRTRKIEL